MYTGITDSTQGGGYTPKTGPAVFDFLGVNPSSDLIQEWIGRDNVQEPNYDLTQNLNGQTVRPIHIWLRTRDSNVVTKFILNVGQDDAIAKSGNWQIITTTGSVVWAKKDGQLKPEFADHKPLKVGEAELITFIQKLINFKVSSGDDFYKQMVNLKQDVTSLYNASYTGLNNLAKWSQENNKALISVLTVRKKDVAQTDGTVTSKFYQSVCDSPKVWLHGIAINDWVKDNIKQKYEESLVVKPGETKAYPIIKDLFTYELQPFKEEDCVNYVPQNPESDGWSS